MDKLLFYDTCSLLNLSESTFPSEKFYISRTTLNELETIKSSVTKDSETKYKARKVYNYLANNKSNYYVIILEQDEENDIINSYDLPDHSPDSKIVANALYLQEQNRSKEVIFITDDILCGLLAENSGLSVQSTSTIAIAEEDNYKGFKIVEVTDEQLATFYSTDILINSNTFNLLENEYLLLKLNGEFIDTIYKWKDNQYQEIVKYQKLKSKMFGEVTPFKDDIYQLMAIDSLTSNKITMLRGRAGTGKSYLAFSYLFSMLDKGTINKIIIFCNTVATAGSAKLGFYPGSRTEKLLDSQIGNLLISKLGGRDEVERLINSEELILLPFSDLRGYDTSGMNAGIYISEAQNLDKELMRLALQRIGEDSICIIDGDYAHQVDMSTYEGMNNGMRRVSKIFRGHDVYGEVELQNIHRSKIAQIAENI